MKGKQKNLFFTAQLLNWNKTSNNRTMPWKYEQDPYKIWLSEIILQQTRVEQGTGYYHRFLQKYPTIKKLAAAEESAVFKLWEGLGYYNRCKNLLHTARHIADKNKGKFPDTYESIITLKGIGPYTAAAISSFAYNLPYAVLDGNVMRLLARFFALNTPIDSNEGKKEFSILAQSLLKTDQAGNYNQSIMDFGATICKPQLPNCLSCPLSSECSSYKTNSVLLYPVKAKRIIKKTRWVNYIIASFDNKYYVRKREGKDIWQNLYEFILVETEAETELNTIMQSTSCKKIKAASDSAPVYSPLYKQLLTHQTIKGQIIQIKLKRKLKLDGYELVESAALKRLAFPKFITQHFRKGSI